MNISIREAFLGREQQKMWAKPVASDWVLAKDISKNVWEDSIIELKSLKTPGGYCHFDNAVRIEDDGLIWGSKGIEAGTLKEWEFYYNQDNDTVFIIQPHSKYQKDEDIKQKIMNYTSEYLKSGGDILQIKTNVDKL